MTVLRSTKVEVTPNRVELILAGISIDRSTQRMATWHEAAEKAFAQRVGPSIPIFVAREDVPAEKGWYRIGDEPATTTRIDESQVHGLKWHERILVDESAIRAPRNLPLEISLRFGCDGIDDGYSFVLRGVSDPSRQGQVAYVDKIELLRR